MSWPLLRARQPVTCRRGNLRDAYRLFSPTSQGALGSMAQFVGGVCGSREYKALLGHPAVATVRRCQNSANTYLELVAVQGATGGG